MKIKTFNAPDMRQGMKAVRLEFGADAVILSSERTATGVALTAAIDFDLVGRVPLNRVAPTSLAAVATDSAIGDELKVLRRLLQTQMSQLAWNEFSRRSPLQAELQREFTAAGLDGDHLRSVLADLSESVSLSAARRMVMIQLADRLRSAGDRWLQYGGRPVLLGTSGAGKTSAALRIAARWVQHHGNRDIALITTDSESFAASEQFAAYARLLGVPSYAAASLDDYLALQATLVHKRCVITDTAAVTGSDAAGLSAWRQVAVANPQLEFALVAGASVRASIVERLLAHVDAPLWQAALITKLDEADHLGELLACLMRHDIPVSYVTRGRRWLADMQVARVDELLALAVQASDTESNAVFSASDEQEECA